MLPTLTNGEYFVRCRDGRVRNLLLRDGRWMDGPLEREDVCEETAFAVAEWK